MAAASDQHGGAAPRRPLHVMHLLYMLGIGGMEEGVVKLANSHAPARVRASICSCQPADELKQRLDPDVPLFEFTRRAGNDPILIGRLVRLMRRDRPDVLHTHGWGTLVEGLLAARLAGVPCVVHGEHGTMETRPRNLRLQRWFWSRADQVLSVSSRLAERMSGLTGFPLDRIRTVHNGVDLSRFRSERGERLRLELKLPGGRQLVGSVGRLVPVKDQSTMLQAFARLRHAGMDASLAIAGKGPLRAELEAEARVLGIADRIHLLGDRHDVPDVLAAFDVFVLSSRSEGLSNTLIEAMASGLPLVATRVGGADEIILEGINGLLVPAQDADALGSAIAALLRDEPRRRRMGAAGRQRARAEFSLEAMVRNYEAVYEEVAVRRGLRAALGRSM